MFSHSFRVSWFQTAFSLCASARHAVKFPAMKIVLAYSGGLDTSVLLSWIKEEYNAEMIAFCANIGQEEELHGLEAKARKTGASQKYIYEFQEEIAPDLIFPLIHDRPATNNMLFWLLRDPTPPLFPPPLHRGGLVSQSIFFPPKIRKYIFGPR